MNRKKNITITAFAFSLLVLIVLQGYYIYNSYRLEEKELNRKAKALAEKIQERMEDAQTEAREDRLVQDFQKLKREIIIQKEEITHPEKLYRSETFYSKKLEEMIKKSADSSGFRIAMKNEIYSVFDEMQKKELLPAKRSIILYQTVEKMKKPMVVYEGKWTSRQTSKDTSLNLNEKNAYLVKSRSTFQVLNLQYLILKKIIPLIIISLLIVILIIILFRNSIRNLNRQEKKIAQLHTTIDSIAHELNTPITTLKFSIARSSDPESKALLERQIRRLENIVASIHTHDAEDVLLEKKDLEEYFAEIKKQHHAIRFNSSIEFYENKRLALNDFRQMMDNLIDNSVKYGADEIEIAVIMDSNIEIKISDNGIGIPDEQHRNIFEKYYRISREANKHTNGLGVGLFLVKRIVDKYRGHIEVRSREKGVSFKITMPDEA
ncbi:HAMP domain-containing histidine kinase [Chryseobacterium sp. SN22]|uniref:sensor histidine kinase n=1 Tax=Chryseobacterium sp. SN22 TaxID=2606431 RepID=UPI0011ECD666|nr:HAMP domain-containing sensor histidine kinase [Chryseobacterium sp. SN22]KAA0126019.1 HAMP domain-containing histidine kinase [Chryseobacterium sp. SN22]